METQQFFPYNFITVNVIVSIWPKGGVDSVLSSIRWLFIVLTNCVQFVLNISVPTNAGDFYDAYVTCSSVTGNKSLGRCFSF